MLKAQSAVRSGAVDVLAVEQYGRVPKTRSVAHIKNLEQIRFKTRDAIELRAISSPPRTPRVTFSWFRAMPCSPINWSPIFRASATWDWTYTFLITAVTAYPKGKAAHAIAADYFEIVSYLNTLGYAKRLLYGISMGGIVLLNAVGRSYDVHAVGCGIPHRAESRTSDAPSAMIPWPICRKTAPGS